MMQLIPGLVAILAGLAGCEDATGVSPADTVHINGLIYAGNAEIPWLGMQVGHNRQDVDAGTNIEFLSPLSERLRLDDLVNGYTSNAAYQLGREDELDTISVG